MATTVMIHELLIFESQEICASRSNALVSGGGGDGGGEQVGGVTGITVWRGGPEDGGPLGV